MKYIILVVSIWVISQTLKFIIRILRGEKTSFENISWIYQWGSGAPSTHAALITASVYLVGQDDNFGSLFGFSFTVAILLLYNLLVERRKQEIFAEYIRTSNDPSLQRAVREGRLLDIGSHSYPDIVIGIALGLLIAVLSSHFYV